MKAGEPGFDLGTAILKVDSALLQRAEDAYDKEEAAPRAAANTARVFRVPCWANALGLVLAGAQCRGAACRGFQPRQRQRQEPRLGRASRALLEERERLGPRVVGQQRLLLGRQRLLLGRQREARTRQEEGAHAAEGQVAKEVGARGHRCAGGQLASVRACEAPPPFAWRRGPPI